MCVCMFVQTVDNGLTVYPDVGVFVSLDELTGQCHIDYQLDALHSHSLIGVCELFYYL